MIDPTGPLPPAVYWRRRVAAVVLSVAAVVLLAWIIGRLVGGADGASLESRPARPSQPPASSSSPPPATGGPSSSIAAPASGSVNVSVSATGSTTVGDTTEVTGPPPTAPPAAPPPPQPCPDTAIQVFTETDAPSYRVGARPPLRLVIANVGPLACFRDVSRGLRELVITSSDGATRLWSSNDCYAPTGVDTRLLQPGERLTFTLNWAGRTSAPGCPIRRGTVPAGSYLVTARLGPITSAPTPLQLTP